MRYVFKDCWKKSFIDIIYLAKLHFDSLSGKYKFQIFYLFYYEIAPLKLNIETMFEKMLQNVSYIFSVSYTIYSADEIVV